MAVGIYLSPESLQANLCLIEQTRRKDLGKVNSLNGFRIMKVSAWRARLDGDFGVYLIVEPFIAVCIPWQPSYKFAAFTPLLSADPHPRLRAASIAVHTIFLPCTGMEGVEYTEPRSGKVRPPCRHDDLVLCVVPYGLFLITGHPGNSELFQEVKLRLKGSIG